MILDEMELSIVRGGSLSATMLNAFSRVISTVYDIGYALGSTLRRLWKKIY